MDLEGEEEEGGGGLIVGGTGNTGVGGRILRGGGSWPRISCSRTEGAALGSGARWR